MACVRCGSPDAPAAEYALEKGGGTVRREFCDNCAEITAAVHSLREIQRLREAPPPDPEGQESEADPEASEAADPAGQEPDPDPEATAPPSSEQPRSRGQKPRTPKG